MSDDLISRSALMSHIESQYRQWREDYDAEQILGDIEDFETAYDVDKTVRELEECRRVMESPVQQECYNKECRVGDCTVCAFEKALEIVKAGGING